MLKYIIDTDIGDDIDDALALDMALRNNLDIVAVTTVFRNVRQRAQIANKLLSLYGKKIPVYAGYGSTLDGENLCFELCQKTDDLTEEKYGACNTDPEDAIDAILDAARRYKKDLYLLSIGPMTNVARAVIKDGKAMRGIGGIILMGGDYVNHYAEWNVFCDITAAKTVFSSGVKIVAFGHEITSLTRISAQQQEFMFNLDGNEYFRYIGELSRLWYKSKPEGYLMILHDLLVVKYALDKGFCKTAVAPIAVETEGTFTRGMTVDMTRMDLIGEAAKKACPVEYATEIDAAEFVNEFMRSFNYCK